MRYMYCLARDNWAPLCTAYVECSVEKKFISIKNDNERVVSIK